jgi:hypothetical protein
MMYPYAVIGIGAAGIKATFLEAQVVSIALCLTAVWGSQIAEGLKGLQFPFPSAESEASFVADIQPKHRD